MTEQQGRQQDRQRAGRLLLVGAGHAHLHLVREAGRLRAAGYAVTLVAPRWFRYSGSASAVAAGDLPAERSRIDVAALARRHGVHHVVDRVADLDPVGRVAVTEAGERVDFDVVSLNVGSAVSSPWGTTPRVLAVKPLDALVELPALLAPLGPHARVTVVGGGASGLELAAQLAVDVRVRLMESGPSLAPRLPPRALRRVERLLAERSVEVRTDVAVAGVDDGGVDLADGTRLEHDVAVLATGLVAPPAVARWGLGDERGVPVGATLTHPDHPHVHAAGDCAHFLPRPLPRVGVFGVRQAPVLLASLEARAAGEPLPEFAPQGRYLGVLDLGGVGLAVRGRLWWWGRSALRLKRRIDERWLAGYR